MKSHTIWVSIQRIVEETFRFALLVGTSIIISPKIQRKRCQSDCNQKKRMEKNIYIIYPMSLQNCSIIEDRAKPNRHIIIIIFQDFFLIFGYLLVEMYFILLYVVIVSLLCDCSALESYRNGWHSTILNRSFFSLFLSNLSFFCMLHNNA